MNITLSRNESLNTVIPVHFISHGKELSINFNQGQQGDSASNGASQKAQ